MLRWVAAAAMVAVGALAAARPPSDATDSAFARVLVFLLPAAMLWAAGPACAVLAAALAGLAVDARHDALSRPAAAGVAEDAGAAVVAHAAFFRPADPSMPRALSQEERRILDLV